MIDRHAVAAFYDRFGDRQDRQGWYEDAALDLLRDHAGLARAACLAEFGCGTGRFAAALLKEVLPDNCRYLGLDASATMVALARARLAPWHTRACVLATDGTMRLPLREGACDRLVATYVLDLLSPADTAALLDEARRVLRPDGLLCVVGITHGTGPLHRLVSTLWDLLWRLNWRWVGGCRPLRAAGLLPPGRWRIVRRETVRAYGITSEVLVAAPAPPEP